MVQAWDDASRTRERLTALVESIPQAVWLSDEGGRWTWSSPRWAAYTGLSDNDSQGRGWIAAIPLNERELVEAAWRDAPAQGMLDVEHGLIHQPGGETRQFHTHAKPLPAAPGQVREWLGTCTDVHAARQAMRRKGALHTEMQCRTHDVAALLRLALREAPRVEGSVQDYALRLESRLGALARTQAMMLSRPGMGLDPEQIITEEAMVHAAHESGQIKAAGPTIPLLGRAASMFGLVVHELMENSINYGALSVPDGRISATWWVDAGDLLRFEWLETGIRLPGGPRRRGFGQELIERLLTRELGGTGSLDIERNGIHCTVTIPLTAGTIGILGR